MVFEVESSDLNDVEAIIKYLEASPNKQFKSDDDKRVIRNFIRVRWFISSLKAEFFLDSRGQPINYIQPCLDPELPSALWREKEKVEWLGWLSSDRYKKKPDKKAYPPAKLWVDVVDYVVVEMIGKSKAETVKHTTGFKFLQYADDLKYRILKATKREGIRLGQLSGRRDFDLWRRWHALGIKVLL